MAAVQLDDYFGPACLELDASERCPFHVLDTLTFDYFDEVWVTGRAFQSREPTSCCACSRRVTPHSTRSCAALRCLQAERQRLPCCQTVELAS